MPFLRQLHWSLLSLLLCGCAAMFVPATSDPAKKLQWAAVLFDQQQRPVPAERLIREAIDIYSRQNDELGLAEAYRQYGFFFRSQAVGKWGELYLKHGFVDKTATYGTRYAKSIEYFGKARDLFLKHEQYGSLTNVYLNMGYTYQYDGNRSAACSSFDKSLQAHRQQVAAHPDGPINLPPGFTSYEEFLKNEKGEALCPGTAPPPALKSPIETESQ